LNHLPCVEIETNNAPTASIIWLHGLGATNQDFVPVVPELRLPTSLGVRFIFPQAPSIPVTINGGMVMPAWYDILSMEIERKIDEAQIKASAQNIIELVEKEIQRGIASDHILLGGFSQGGAVVYEAALSYGKPLAGLFALSTYFATHQSIELSAANAQLPILICHGSNDPVVPELLGQRAVSALQENGFSPVYRRYPMEHELCLPQVNDLSEWIQKALE